MRTQRSNTGSTTRGAGRRTAAPAGSRRADPQTEAPFGGVLVPLVLVLVVISSLAVVQSSHRARKLFSELQDLRSSAMKMDEEWGRLLLEQSTWASPDRVQRMSEGQLKMRPPKVNDIVIVRAYGDAA